MALDRGMGVVRLVASLGTMLKMLKELMGFDMWGASLAMVPVQLVAMVV